MGDCHCAVVGRSSANATVNDRVDQLVASPPAPIRRSIPLRTPQSFISSPAASRSGPASEAVLSHFDPEGIGMLSPPFLESKLLDEQLVS